MRYNFIAILMLLATVAFSQSTIVAPSDTIKPKEPTVLVPVGEKLDTVKVRALIDPLNATPLFVRNYLLITRSYVFAPESKEPNKPVEQWVVLDAPGVQPRIKDFGIRTIWIRRR
jgi:hypothetical protein